MPINSSRSMQYYDYPPEFLWRFLCIGYLLTIAIEAPILLVGLSREHSLERRLFAGVWLTACTYPIVVLVLPLVVPPLFANPEAGDWAYLAVAETFAPVAECLLFSMLVKPQAANQTAGHNPSSNIATWHDYLAIIMANLASFLGGGWLIQNVAWLKHLIHVD